jgi:hypothetical protein
MTVNTLVITQHADWSDAGAVRIVHGDDRCRFIEFGSEPERRDDLDTIECRFCIGGDDVRALGRPGRTEFVAGSETERNEGNYKRPSEPRDDDSAGLSAEERFARVAQWLDALGRKVEVSDVTHANKRVAQDWLRNYSGDFDFLVDLKAKRSGHGLSDPQAKGVLNCLRAELRRPKSAPPAESVAVSDSVADLLP